MRSLLRAYGPWLTGALCLLAASWVLGLVLVPLAAMLEQSLWRLERPAAAADLSARLDRLYNELAVAELEASDLPAGSPERDRADAALAAARAEIAALEAAETRPVRVYGPDNYLRLLSGLHLRVFLRTLLYAALVTALALVACYPVAYATAIRAGPRAAPLLFLLLLVPYAINELLRTYAWLMILDYRGVLNSALGWLGLVDLEAGGWVPFLEHPGATFAAMVYAYVLFMVFPIHNALETLDRAQIEAARDLGARPWRIHRRVIIPHAKPGIAVGCVMTFMLSAGSYAVPQIMARGTGGDWFTQLIYRQFYEAADWNVGAAYAFSLLAACVLFVLLVMALFRVGVRDIAR
jgi:spermidine/putrescine transport system permease protein